jgi:hypothetical protein
VVAGRFVMPGLDEACQKKVRVAATA